MCYLRLENFTAMLLFSFLIYFIRIKSSNADHSVNFNSSEEIKKIFHSSHALIKSNTLIPMDVTSIGNFAEGGLIPVNEIRPNLTEKASITNQDKVLLNSNKIISEHRSNLTEALVTSMPLQGSTVNNMTKPVLNTTTKIPSPTKLNENGTNLFLGGPEVFHVNGVSSIKPRKGVHFNKIVPRKGVDNENEGNHAHANHFCFFISKNACYSASDFNDLECNCCKKANLLGGMIKQQPLINCSSCDHINVGLHENDQPCEHLCCQSKSIGKETYKVIEEVGSQNKDYQNTINTEIKKQNITSTTTKIKNENVNIKEVGSTLYINSDIKENKTTPNTTSSIKQKPSITKVPYDVEIVIEMSGKAKKDVLIPVIVSIFLLPLVGILLFLIWRRTKEYWDKRYYKRMDFLIDGMYND